MDLFGLWGRGRKVSAGESRLLLLLEIGDCAALAVFTVAPSSRYESENGHNGM